MSGYVFNRFKILLSEKEVKERRKITYDELINTLGIAGSTLSSWANNKVKRYDANTIAALCDYFDCEVSDLIVYAREVHRVD